MIRSRVREIKSLYRLWGIKRILIGTISGFIPYDIEEFIERYE